jgi:sRNA-binding protein
LPWPSCSRLAYAASAAEATHRVSLDGTPCAALTAEERAAATVRLAEVQAKIKRRATQKGAL